MTGPQQQPDDSDSAGRTNRTDDDWACRPVRRMFTIGRLGFIWFGPWITADDLSPVMDETTVSEMTE